jgi:hypothetical protein
MNKMWLGICNEDDLWLIFDKDDLKILKVEYRSNHWLDLPQTSNLGSGDQTKIKYDLKYEMKITSDGSSMEDDLKILKVEYLSNHW